MRRQLGQLREIYKKHPETLNAIMRAIHDYGVYMEALMIIGKPTYHRNGNIARIAATMGVEPVEIFPGKEIDNSRHVNVVVVNG